MDKTFESYIGESKSVLIVLPTKPTFDQAAAALSLFVALETTKSASIYSPDEMTVVFNRLVGVNKIKGELVGKNLIIQFNNYDWKNIERVSSDMESGIFQLTVIPKEGSVIPNQKDIVFSQSGVSEETVILVGGVQESHFPVLESSLVGKRIFHIGNRPLVSDPAKNILSFARDASSHSEVVASSFMSGPQSEVSGVFSLNQDVATNLLMGIDGATSSLSSQNATADTFFIVSMLMRAGGRRDIGNSKPSQFPLGSIPSAKQNPKQSTQIIKKQSKSQIHKKDNLAQKGEKSNIQKQKQVVSRPIPSYTTKPVSSGVAGNDQNPPKDWLEKPRVFKGGVQGNPQYKG